MQTLNLDRPDMPDLQFVLLVTALCTSRLTTLNIPNALRSTIFDRCWVLIHESPPPRRPEARVLDLRPWTELTVEAMAETIRVGLTEAGIHTLAWDHRPSEPTRASTPQAQVLIDRLAELYPHPSKAQTQRQERRERKRNVRREQKGPEVRPLRAMTLPLERQSRQTLRQHISTQGPPPEDSLLRLSAEYLLRLGDVAPTHVSVSTFDQSVGLAV